MNYISTFYKFVATLELFCVSNAIYNHNYDLAGLFAFFCIFAIWMI